MRRARHLATPGSARSTFTFQLFLDFSAYSEMAIGLGLMLGFRFPDNFNAPYQATSIRDFWRRWHMTLSRFLRDYLYIPLGGSRHGRVTYLKATLVTMGLCGLWHGAGLTFVVWGLLHGVALIVCRVLGGERAAARYAPRLGRDHVVRDRRLGAVPRARFRHGGRDARRHGGRERHRRRGHMAGPARGGRGGVDHRPDHKEFRRGVAATRCPPMAWRSAWRPCWWCSRSAKASHEASSIFSSSGRPCGNGFSWHSASPTRQRLGPLSSLLFLVDPLSVSPVALVMPKHGYALKDRRFLVPQVIRSGQFDSLLVGSSTIHSVDPAWAEAAFGGHFANIAIHGITPYELTRVLGLVGASVSGLRRLILGLDADVWCDPVKSAQRYHVKAVFPERLYDTGGLAHLPLLLNGKMVGMAMRQLMVDLGLKRAPVPPNGYRNELDEARWKPFKPGESSCHLDCDAAAPQAPAPQPGNGVALDLLEQALAAQPEQAEIIVVLMPPYVSTLPSTAAELARIDQCKQRIAAVVSHHAGFTVDFDIASPWTKEVNNYWDDRHFRIVDRQGAVASGEGSDGTAVRRRGRHLSHVERTRLLGRSLAIAITARTREETMSVEVGDKAPDFTLPADGGGTVSLKALRGKTVVLYFYPKDDTSGCTAEACAFRDALPDFSKVKAEIVGVSRDPVASHDKFKKKFKLPFPLAADEDGKVCRAYGVWVEKSMYGKKYMGIERATFLIDAKGVVHKVWRKVKVPGHAEDVLAAAAGMK